jgi:hypothetical protein
VWHVVVCAASCVLGLVLGWARGHYVGYGQGRIDGSTERDVASDVETFLKGK